MVLIFFFLILQHDQHQRGAKCRLHLGRQGQEAPFIGFNESLN